MVNEIRAGIFRTASAMKLEVPARDPELLLALHYARRHARRALAALFALDGALAQILRTTREPMVGQMRFTWWHEALTTLDTAPPPAEPILQGIASDVVPQGIAGARIAGMIDGWEELLEAGPLDDDALLRHAGARGASLFAMAGALAGAGARDPLELAGAGWALADLARHLSDPTVAARALALAEPRLLAATRLRWSRPGRALGALAQIARMNCAVPLDQPVPAGAPGRVARLLFHRVTGR